MLSKLQLFCILIITYNDYVFSKVNEQYFIRMLKENSIEEKLFNSEVFKDCAKKAKELSNENTVKEIKETNDCLERIIKKLNKNEADSLIQKLELSKVEIGDDPNQKNITEYIKKLVEISLYGKNQDKSGVLNNVSQEMFTLIYERVVGKALFFEMSHHCLEDKFSEKTGDNSSIEMKKITGLDPDKTRIMVKECLGNIKNGCKLTTNENGKEIVEFPNRCLFNRRLIEFKNIIKRLQADKEEWKALRENSNLIFKLDNLDAMASQQRSVGEIATKLTSISSTNLVDEGYKEDQGHLTEQYNVFMKNCANNIKDPKCDQYKVGNSLGQYRLQKEIMLDLKIQSLQGASREELQIIAVEGSYFSKEELANMSEAEIKQKLEEKYKAEKLSIQQDINKRITNIGLHKDKENKEAKEKIKGIANLLKNRPEELRTVHFFSNMIVYFFDFENDSDEGKKIMSGFTQEEKDLQLKLQKNTNDEQTKSAIEYLRKFPVRSVASKDENYYLKPEELDKLLYGVKNKN